MILAILKATVFLYLSEVKSANANATQITFISVIFDDRLTILYNA